MKLDEDQTNKLLLEIVEQLGIQNDPPENSFTSQMVAEAAGVTAQHTNFKLNKLVEAGEMECGFFVVEGSRRKYYWRSTDKG